MANEEQLKILRHGVVFWNEWRKGNQGASIDLSNENLMFADLRQANFREVHLNGTNLAMADLSEADLGYANLEKADLHEANLEKANLGEARLQRIDLRDANLVKTGFAGADLTRADLTKAQLVESNLSEAGLYEANLAQANLFLANFSGANLSRTNLWGTELRESNFSEAVMDLTIFGNSDLTKVTGLEKVVHRGPSIIAIDTFIHSNGKIPEVFLRGCGLSDWEIEEVNLYNPDLSNDDINKILYKMYDLRATQALQISPLFISYSHGDRAFVDRLERGLNKKGIRFWRDIHDMKAGRLETQIDRAISQNRTVLLVLSDDSLKSDWVEHEVRTARALEKDMGRDVLCPVALDGSWKDSKWPKRIMEQIREYNILDFSAWRDDSKFDGMFRKLIDGLELFYKG